MRTYGTAKSLLYGMIVTVVLLLLLEFVAHMVEFIKPAHKSQTLSKLLDSQRQHDSFRIFVYGGSTVEGMPIKDFGFVSQLEFWLGEMYPEKPFEVYNFGLSGRPSAYVLSMVEETVTLEPDLLIVLTGHNEFLSRNIEGFADQIEAGFALTRVLIRLSSTVKSAFPQRPKNHVTPILEGYDRDSVLFKNKVQEYLNNLESIVQIARENSKPLLLLTAPSNVSDWPPLYKGLATNSYGVVNEPLIEKIDGFLANGISGQDIESIQKLTQAYGDHPILLYLQAKARVAAGDYNRARILYSNAKDLDPIPWRVLTDFNQAIREYAKMDGVYLVDIEKRFQQQSVNGLVGFSLIADNCHPTPLGNTIITRDILALIRQEQFLVGKEFDQLSVDESLEHFLSASTSPDDRGSLEMRYLLENAKYSMKTPFYNYRASKQYLDKALAMDSSNWEVWVNLATLTLFENRIEDGREQLKMAIKLRGAPIEQNDRGSAPYLKEALEQSGVSIQSL